MIKVSLETTASFLKKYYFFILGTIFVVLVSSNFLIYYKYVHLSMNTDPGITSDEIKIDKETIQKVLDNINIREDNLDRVKINKYFNPFDD